MIPERYTKRFAPFLLFVILLLDTHFSTWVSQWSGNYYIANAHLIILLILVLSEVLNERFMILTAVVIGLLFDLYYVGVIGIYASVLPAMVALIYFFNNAIHQSLLTLFFSMIIFVTFFELSAVLLQILFKLAVVDSNFFITNFLGPTLLLNMIIFVIFIYPLHHLFTQTEERLY